MINLSRAKLNLPLLVSNDILYKDGGRSQVGKLFYVCNYSTRVVVTLSLRRCNRHACGKFAAHCHPTASGSRVCALYIYGSHESKRTVISVLVDIMAIYWYICIYNDTMESIDVSERREKDEPGNWKFKWGSN